jgi:transcriptional regulator with XRE-family HTH domain
VVTKKKRAKRPAGETNEDKCLQVREKVGKKVRKIRQEHDLTLEDLEYSSGVSSNHLSKIEHGKCELRLKSLQAIAKGLGVPAEVLVNGGGVPAHGYSERGLEAVSLFNNAPPKVQEAIKHILQRYPDASPEERHGLLLFLTLAADAFLGVKT